MYIFLLVIVTFYVAHGDVYYSLFYCYMFSVVTIVLGFVAGAMKLQISLFRHLQNLIEVLGGRKSEVVFKDLTPGKVKFVIFLDLTKIPCRTVSSLPIARHYFTGDDAYNTTIAEHKAVISVQNFIEAAFAVQIHDLSYSKILILESKIGHVVSSINAFSSRLHTILKEYQSCINLLAPIISCASQNSSSLFTANSKSLSALCNVSQSTIEFIKEQVVVLDHEFTLYCCSGSSTKSNNTFKVLPPFYSICISVFFFSFSYLTIYCFYIFQPPPIVCEVFVKDFLSDVLGYFDLPSANYSVEVTEKDVYIGICSLCHCLALICTQQKLINDQFNLLCIVAIEVKSCVFDNFLIEITIVSECTC